MSFRLPLSALLSQALTAFTDEFEAGLADHGHPELSLALGSNILRFLDEHEPLRAGAIAELAGVSKQAISQQLAYLETHGHVTVTADPDDRRAKAVTLTAHGAQVRDTCRPLFGHIEKQWEHRYGRVAITQLRAALETLVDQLADDLPHFPRQRQEPR